MTYDPKRHLAVSFTDFFDHLKKAKKNVARAALLGGLLFLCFKLYHKPLYKAKGVFRQASIPSSNKTLEALKALSEGVTPLNEESPLLLDSHLVLNKVVEKLHLQGHIIEKKRSSLFKNMWGHLVTEGAYLRYFLQKKPLSSILDDGVVIPDRLVLEDIEKCVLCQDIHYTRGSYTNFTIHFEDEHHFTVFQSQNLLGNGSLDNPFIFEDIQFCLKRPENAPTSELIQKDFCLSLIPLDAAQLSLQKKLKFKRNKLKKGLINITYTHPDRILAANIVNEVMFAYSDFLKHEGQKKIENLLTYLEKRRLETENVYHEELNKAQATRAQTVEEGGFVTLSQEINFIASSQAEYQKKLATIAQEIRKLSPENETLDFSLAKARKARYSLPQLLQICPVANLSSAEKLFLSYAKDLNQITLEKAALYLAQDKLSDPHFEIISLENTLSIPNLTPFFKETQALHLKLLDTKNWTPKEQSLLKEELDTKKSLLRNLLKHHMMGLQSKELFLIEKNLTLKQILLIFLVDEYEIASLELKKIKDQFENLSSQVLNEKKLSLTTKIHEELLETLVELIETKNAAIHLEGENSFPFEMSVPSLIPKHPHLFWLFIFGSLSGFSIFAIFLFIKELSKGLKASYSNLEELGFKAFTSSKEISFELFQRSNEKNVVLLSSKESTSFQPLLNLMIKRQEKLLFLNLTTKTGSLFKLLEGENIDVEISHKTGFDSLEGPLNHPYKEELLSTQKFQTLLTSWKSSYKWIFIQNENDPESIETRLLSEFSTHVIFQIKNEKVETLLKLPQKTLFLTQNEKNESVSLKNITPILDKMGAKPKLVSSLRK